MTATLDYKTDLISRLINSCYNAQAGYRQAASCVEDATLKRLFEIYAQQRTRFAEELTEYLPAYEVRFAQECETESQPRLYGESGQEFLRQCLEADARNLAHYKEALAHRALPSRAQFVISSQLALMERVHDRLTSILAESITARPAMLTQRISA